MRRKTYIHGSSEPEQERLSRLNALTNTSFISFLGINPSDNILEIGSGLGILAEKVSEKLIQGKLTGIEISEEQLAKCPPEGKKLQFLNGDVHKLPFADNSFDKVYGRYILEHLTNPELALKEAYRVMRQGGEIYIQENSILVIEFFPDCPEFKKIWGKFARLQQKLGGDAMIGIKLNSLLIAVGFEDIVLSMAPEIHWYGKESFEPWIRNLIKNIEGGSKDLVSHKLTVQGKINTAIHELEEFLSNPSASTYFYWNRAKAVKPKLK
jgi:ubiquinone/menaquinone biosynthesis C-methylase UbiE